MEKVVIELDKKGEHIITEGADTSLGKILLAVGSAKLPKVKKPK